MPARAAKPEELTPRAVVRYARDLRERRERAVAKDPYADPYAPSDDVARKLASQLGPAAAIRELAKRAHARELEAEEQEARAVDGRARHRHERLEAAGREAAERELLSLGQRLDVALLGLGVLSDVTAAHLGERVAGSKDPDAVPRLPRDRARKLADEARVIVEQLERELEHARRRAVEGAAA